MAKLSKDEEAMLKRLSAKAEAPDEPPVGRSLNVTLDLGKPEQVSLAQRFGFLPADETEEAASSDEEGDETPKRRGYFGE